MKNLLKRAARRLGFEISRTRDPNGPDPFAVMTYLVSEPSPIIFDVGAYGGQTAWRFRELFPKAVIHCFEPFPASYDRLSSSVADDPLTKIYRMALSDSSGSALLNTNRYDATSSLLSSDPRASRYWVANSMDTVGQIDVVTETIDEFC